MTRFSSSPINYGILGYSGGEKMMYYMDVVMSGMPIVGGFFKAYDDLQYMDDYMRNRGLSYGDIRYPSRTPGASLGSAVGGGLSFVSKNIEKLYSNDNSAIDREVRRRLRWAYGVW